MRADRYLVAHGFFETRAQAQAAIAAGAVRIDGALARKASQSVPAGAVIEAEPAHPYVSRGALKLIAALDAFAIDPSGLACLDLGASTGGFTQVLLSRDAARVFAVDVGTGQLHSRLRGDPRMISLEGVDARDLTAALIAEPPSLITADLSFIGLEKALERPLSLAVPGARLIALFKPQFQVGRAAIGKGGIVKDAAAVEAAAAALEAWLAARGWPVKAWIDSPIPGGDGNRERLVWAARG